MQGGGEKAAGFLASEARRFLLTVVGSSSICASPCTNASGFCIRYNRYICSAAALNCGSTCTVRKDSSCSSMRHGAPQSSCCTTSWSHRVGCSDYAAAVWRASWLRCYWSSTTSKRLRLQLLQQQWPLIRQEMVKFFDSQLSHITCRTTGEASGAAEAAGDTRCGSQDASSQASGGGSGSAFNPSLCIRRSSGCGRSSNSSSTDEDSRGIFRITARSGKVNLLCHPWERFVRKEELQRANYVPCIVQRYGVERRLAIHRDTLEAFAFEEEHGHLSHFFQARLFRLHIGEWIEECIPTYVQADPVARRLYFVKFDRHIPGIISEVDVPTSLVGLLACPAYQKGYHVELIMPTIRCQCVGVDIPPPIFVDVSRLRFRPPYSAITIADLRGILPRDGSARFHPAYGDLQKQEVVWAYEVGTLPDAPLPDEFVDPNFIDRKGQKMDVMFRRQFPK